MTHSFLERSIVLQKYPVRFVLRDRKVHVHGTGLLPQSVVNHVVLALFYLHVR